MSDILKTNNISNNNKKKHHITFAIKSLPQPDSQLKPYEISTSKRIFTATKPKGRKIENDHSIA